MDRKTFIRSVALAPAASVAIPSDDVTPDQLQASPPTPVGPDDVVLVRFSDEVALSAEEWDGIIEGLGRDIKEALGCKKVVLTQGVVGIDVIGPGAA